MSPDPGIRIHRKQFVVGPGPHRPDARWLVMTLPNALTISYCPELELATMIDADGAPWLLIGLASQTMADRPDPIDDIARSPTAAVPSAAEGWAGRWVLIGQGELHLDATGQLPCHWFVDDDGSPWASSSPALLAALAVGRREVRPDLVYERGLSWVVPPLGTVEGARRLLPSQILDLRVGTTRWRRLAVPPAELDLEPGDNRSAGHGFVDALGRAMARLRQNGPRLLGLTAGADSRLILAAAAAAGVEVEPYTRLAARMSIADRVTPPRLAAAVGLPHRFVGPGQTDPARMALAAAHSGGHVSDGDALPFAQGVRDHFTGVELGGQGLGAGKVKHRHLPADIVDPIGLADAVADDAGEPAGSPNRAALAAWLAAVAEHHRQQHSDEQIDWRDRLYLEQRTAGWQAAKEQVYDLNRHRRFFPINSARTIGWLLAIDPAVRRTGQHRRDLIALADDRLLGEPFNRPGSDFPRRIQLRHALAVDRRGLVSRVRRRTTGQGVG